ncbi:MAG: hypothetical protein ACQEP0_07400, partial [Natrinema limicola]
MTADLPAGFAYMRIEDPSGGDLPLTGVTRSDGTPIDMEFNAWQTFRIQRPKDDSPQTLSHVHIFDHVPSATNGGVTY